MGKTHIYIANKATFSHQMSINLNNTSSYILMRSMTYVTCFAGT